MGSTTSIQSNAALYRRLKMPVGARQFLYFPRLMVSLRPVPGQIQATASRPVLDPAKRGHDADSVR